MVNRIFDKKNVILLKVNEDDLNTFLVDMDIDDEGNPKYCLDDFTKAICNTIPEYVFAQYEDPNIPQNDIVEKLREAAHCIYKIKDFQLMKQWCVDKDINAYNELKRSSTAKRGEFGELLLHLILREFKHTIPLISKVYFKDSASVPAHGFDAVHVSTNEKILWLGESKLYDDSKEGIKALVKDLNEHINTDYLNDQFVIIKKNLDNNSIPGREEWIDTITNCTKLSDKLNIINIPMLCTYTHDIYKKFSDMNDPNAIAYHELNVRELKEYFDKQNKMPLKDRVNIILMLFPVMAVFCSLFIGTEYSEGTIRNKIIIGQKRGTVYLSNFITCSLVSVVMCMAFFIPYLCIGIPLLGFFEMDIKIVLLFAVTVLMTAIVFSSIFTLISMLNNNKAVTAVICILTAFLFLIIGAQLHKMLSEPETNMALVMTDNGQEYQELPNPKFLDGGGRKTVQFFYDFLPGGQVVQCTSLETENLSLLPVYSLVIVVLTTSAGMFFFKKKELK